jgi:hypothetical protein
MSNSRRIHRSGAPAEACHSSDDEDDDDDAFAVLARKKNKRAKTALSSDENPPPLPVSAPKRHYPAASASDARKQKLDALVKELSTQTSALPTGRRDGSIRGSFVQPGEEHVTTNVFVGNLPPSITEEEVGQLFSQFGTTTATSRAT